MLKKNIYIALSLFVGSILILSFQNCGQSTGHAPVADGKIVVDDFNIHESDCSAGASCKVTVVKTNRDKKEVNNVYPSVEYDFSTKPLITDEELPLEFYSQNESGVYVKCVFVNRRDDIRFEYICAN